MRRSWAEAGLLLGMGVAAILEGVRLVTQKHPNTLYDVLGPGLYICLLGVALLAAAMAVACGGRTPAPLDRDEPGASVSRRMTGTVGVLVGYALLLGVAGYLVATVLFFVAEFRLTGAKSWREAALLGAGYAAVFYLVFVYECNLVFPRGVLFH